MFVSTSSYQLDNNIQKFISKKVKMIDPMKK